MYENFRFNTVKKLKKMFTQALQKNISKNILEEIFLMFYTKTEI